MTVSAASRPELGVGPVVLLGCGRLGSAILEGWLKTGAVAAADLVILTPSEKPIAETARALGARVNPAGDELAQVLGAARALVVAVKPAKWREASQALLADLGRQTAVVSVMAGVRTASLNAVFGPRPVVRVMPTTAVAQAQGVAAIWSATDEARSIGHDLFDALADVVDLDEERHIDAATAVAGSGPAYVHAFVRAMAAAGAASGLDAESALRLARGALRSAAAADPAETIDALIARIASPGGTTEAGLKALNAGKALDEAVEAAVAAALARARQLAAD